MSLDCHEELPYEQDLLYCHEKPLHESMQLGKNGIFLKEKDTCRDARIFQNVVRLTETYRLELKNYMSMNLQDVDSESYFIVTEWMRDVLKEFYKEDKFGMTAQAIHVMNQFLGVGSRLSPSSLQGLAASCLLLVSKANCTFPLPLQTAISYTNDAYTAENLKDFEKLVLCRCRYDMSPATRAEIVAPLIHELSQRWEAFYLLNQDARKTFRLETEYFLTLTLFQYKLNFEKSSVLVAACMMLAFNKMLHHRHLMYHYTDCFLEIQLRNIIESEDGEIEECATKLRGCLKDGRNQEIPFMRRFSVASPTPEHFAPSAAQPAQQPSQHLVGQDPRATDTARQAAARQATALQATARQATARQATALQATDRGPFMPSYTIDLTLGDMLKDSQSDQETNRASQEVEASVLLDQDSQNIYFNSYN